MVGAFFSTLKPDRDNYTKQLRGHVEFHMMITFD